MGRRGERTGVPLGGLVKAVIGYAGLAMCLTLVFLGMRAVMDSGGSCADGGQYVVATSCPEGSAIALLGGIFAGVGFAVLATLGGVAVGGIWSAAPLFAWSGLFGSLGWNFLDYGVFNADPAYGIDVGWALCGVLFWIMAAAPLLGIIPALRGPGELAHRPIVMNTSGSTVTTVSRDAGQTEASHEELAKIAADFGAAITSAAAATPLGEAVPRGGGATPDDEAATPTAGTPGDEPEFTEGTQALLDRLERLADMRDRDLLGPDEYETAKAAIMGELEGRS